MKNSRCLPALLAVGHLPARRALWMPTALAETRPEALSTNVCPRLQMVGSAGNGRGQGRSRSRCLAVARPRPGNQVESILSRRRRGANARSAPPAPRDGRNGCEPRFADVRRGAVFQNYQLAGSIGQVVPSPIIGRDDASQHRLRSGVQIHLAGTERFSPSPPQASISHQTSRHKSAHADVLASVAERPHWLTPCSTKLLSVTYWAGARAMRKNMKSPKSSAPSTSWMRNGSVPNTVTGCPVLVFATNPQPATHKSAS